MGAGYSNQQFQATNYVLDYSINLMHPDRYGIIMQRLGPNANSFPAQGKNLVLSDFNECLNSNPQLVAEYHKLRNMICVALLIFIGAFAAIMFLSTTESIGSSLFGVIFFAAILLCVGISCIVHTKGKTLAHNWRTNILCALEQKVSIWKAMYPTFTFTIIYPVEVWRSTRRNGRRTRRRLVAIWCYVRVTYGPCQTGHNEPVYATSTNVIAPAQGIQPVMIQQQQGMQQVVMQQPVMIQQQPIMGTAAIVNGQQVIVVQQAPQQQFQQMPMQRTVVMQQPIRQNVQNVQYVNAAPSGGYPGAR